MQSKKVSLLSLKIVFLAPFFHLHEFGWFSIASERVLRQRNVCAVGVYVRLCRRSWRGGKGVLVWRACLDGRLLPMMLSCAEVDCKKAQFFWLFKVRPEALHVRVCALECVPRGVRRPKQSAWVSTLSRIGGNIFGFCVFSYRVL